MKQELIINNNQATNNDKLLEYCERKPKIGVFNLDIGQVSAS